MRVRSLSSSMPSVYPPGIKPCRWIGDSTGIPHGTSPLLKYMGIFTSDKNKKVCTAALRHTAHVVLIVFEAVPSRMNALLGW